MNEKGYPWDSNGEDKREYGAQHLANAFKRMVSNGPLHDYDFSVTALTGNTVRVGPGEAWINGHTISIVGYEDVEIPYITTASPNVYGCLVLGCDESVAARSFYLAYNTPTGDEPGAAGENEIELARIRYNRPGGNLTDNDITKITSILSMPVNGTVSDGSYTDLNGLIKGDGMHISVASPGVDYMSPAGGNFTGKITYDGNPIPSVSRATESETGNTFSITHNVERYSDGFVRIKTIAKFNDVNSQYVKLDKVGSSPVYMRSFSMGFNIPVKYEGNPFVLHSNVGGLLCSCEYGGVSEKVGTIYIGDLYKVLNDNSSTYMAPVKIHILTEGYEKT